MVVKHQEGDFLNSTRALLFVCYITFKTRTPEELDGTLPKIAFLENTTKGGLQLHPGAVWKQM